MFNTSRTLGGDPGQSSPLYSWLVVQDDQIGRCFEWELKNRGPVWQQAWHDKDPSLLKGHKRRAKV